MSEDLCDVTRMMKIDNESQLDETRSKTLLQIIKMEFILDILKWVDASKFDVSDKQHLQKIIQILAIQDYLRLPTNDTILGLENVDTVTISYIERKALREHVFAEIKNICPPVISFVANMEKQIPFVFDPEGQQKEFLELEEKRRHLYHELIEVKQKKCELLKTCMDLKSASYEKNTLEILLAEFKLNGVKVDTLYGFLIQEFCTRTPHTMKAIREVERFIDDELEKLEEWQR